MLIGTGHAASMFVKAVLAVHFPAFTARSHCLIGIVRVVDMAGRTGKLSVVIHCVLQGEKGPIYPLSFARLPINSMATPIPALTSGRDNAPGIPHILTGFELVKSI